MRHLFFNFQRIFFIDINRAYFFIYLSICGHLTKLWRAWIPSVVCVFFYYYYLVCEAISTAATPGLLCHPRVIVKMMIVEKQMECRLAGETEVIGENMPQRHFCPSQNPIWLDPGLNPDRRGGKPATNRLSYGAAYVITFTSDECCGQVTYRNLERNTVLGSEWEV
jgi:hypothetical protein